MPRRVGNQFFIIVAFSGLEDIIIRTQKYVRLFLRNEIEIGFADDIALLSARELTERIVDQHKPMAAVLYKDRVGNLVDNCLESFSTAGNIWYRFHGLRPATIYPS